MFDPNSSNSGRGRRSLLDHTDEQPQDPDDADLLSLEAFRDPAPQGEPAALPPRDRGTGRQQALNRLRIEKSHNGSNGEPSSDEPSDDGSDAASAISPDDAPPKNTADASAGAQSPRPSNGALIDPVVMIATAWRYRLFVVFTTILGAALGVMLALSTPREYESVSQFVLDPRELRLTDTDFLPQSYSADAILALVDSQVQIVDSSPVLEQVVADLGLDEDPEFNGMGTGGGIGSVTDLFRSLFSQPDGGGVRDRSFIAIQSLARAVNVYRGDNTFIVYVGVSTEDPAKSALIANRIVNVYIANQRAAQSALFERTSASLTQQLDELRQDVQAAERRVEQYKAENDLVDAGGNLISDEQIIRFNEQLAQVRARKAEIQAKAESAAQLDVDSLLSGTSPEILQSSTITELRTEHAAAKRIADTLSTSLGPRHPQRIAANKALDTIRSEIRNELRRIVEATQTELRRIIQSEQQLASDLAILKSKQIATSADLVSLRELEREANATTQIYESFLRRARETREKQDLNTSNIQIVSEATPALKPTGPSRKIIAAGGMFAGFVIGVGITLLAGAYRSLAGRLTGTVPLRNGTVAAPAPAPAAGDRESNDDGRISAGDQLYADPAERSFSRLHPANDDDLSSGGLHDIEELHGPQYEAAVQQDASALADGNEPDPEVERIRADIRKMRETLERLRQAQRRSNNAGPGFARY
ncbi:MAG: GumC family protein [Pseudomonadota bacterium]